MFGLDNSIVNYIYKFIYFIIKIFFATWRWGNRKGHFEFKISTWMNRVSSFESFLERNLIMRKFSTLVKIKFVEKFWVLISWYFQKEAGFRDVKVDLTRSKNLSQASLPIHVRWKSIIFPKVMVFFWKNMRVTAKATSP